MSEVLERETVANAIVKKHAWWSFGSGCIPLPLLDFVAVSGIQVKMLHELSKLYDVPFAENRAKSIISALIGGMVSNNYGWGMIALFGSWMKAFPILGPLLGVASMAVFSGASTYAVGSVFVKHFESGGTMLNFDAKKMREHFRQQFEEGKGIFEAADGKDDKTKNDVTADVKESVKEGVKDDKKVSPKTSNA